MDKIEEALKLATEAHFLQKRKGSGIPYVVHPIEVMKRVSDYGIVDDAILIAAVLHDVIEDCEQRYTDQLARLFGPKILNIVEECSRPERDGATKADKYRFLESFKSKSIESVIIKIADRMCNVMDYYRVKPKYAAEYAMQAYPLVRAFITRFMDYDSYVLPRKAAMKILGDIIDINIIVTEHWERFSSFIPNLDGFVKSIVIGDERNR